MLQIRVRSTPSTTVLELAGRLQLAAGEATLRALVAMLARFDRPHVTLDLQNVTAVDAAGLGALVWAKIEVERRKGRLVLANPGRRLRRLLEITRLDRAFDLVCHDDRSSREMVECGGLVRAGVADTRPRPAPATEWLELTA